MNNSYVYLHLDSEGVIRYVGVGNELENDQFARANFFVKRSESWYSIFKESPPEVVIVERGLSRKDAISLEYYLYHSCKDTIVNIAEPRMIKELDFDTFNEYFYIDESSKSGLKLKKKVKGNQVLNVGDDVGSIVSTNGKSYWRVKLFSEPFKAHRVIWLLKNGSLQSTHVINHIDGNGLNNSLSNLEEVTYSVNSTKRKNNSSTQGISETVYKGRIDGYLAKFKNESKRFGTFAFNSQEKALEAALRWRKYKEAINGICVVDNLSELEQQVKEDIKQTLIIRRTAKPVQLASGKWSFKFKYSKDDPKYTNLNSYESKEDLIKDFNKLIDDYNSKIEVNI